MSRGTFHAWMGTIKDRNSKDLTEEIKKRWQEYTEELYKKGLNDPDNHNGVVTNLKPDILECEVKWPLGALLQTKPVEVTEFQSIPRRDKKAFLSEQCKVVEKNKEWERLEISSRKLGISRERYMQRWA